MDCITCRTVAAPSARFCSGCGARLTTQTSDDDSAACRQAALCADERGSRAEVVDRAAAESRIRESEERLRLSLKAAGQGLYDLDVTTGRAIVSPEYATMIGYDPDTFEETNARWAERMHPEDREAVFGTYERYLRGEISEYRVEFRQRTRDGGWLWTLSIGSIVSRDADGRPLRMLGTHTNIQERKAVEIALRESEARLSEAQEIAQIGSWQLDLQTSRLAWSDEIFRIFEIDPGRFGASYEAFLNAIHPGDREMVNAAFAASLESRRPYEIVHRLLMRDGRIKFVHERCRTFYDDAGKPLRSVGTVQDITERKRDEQELLRKEASFRTLFEQAAVGMVRGVPGNYVTHINRKLTEMLGYSLEEIQRLGIERITHPDDFAADEAQFARLLSGEISSYDLEKRYIRKNGEILWAHLTITALKEAGRIVELYGVVQDIHARKQAEEALRLGERRFRTLVEHATDAFFLHDEHGTVVDCNEQACRSLGYARHELLGMSVPAYNPALTPDDIARVRGQLVAGEIVTLDTRHRRKDGVTFPVEVRIRGFELNGEQFFLALARDVTERRKLEAELRWKEIIVKNMFAGAVVVGLSGGTILYASGRYERMFGYAPGELLGQPITIVNGGEDDLPAKTYRQLAESLRSHGTWQGELLGRRKDGSTFWTHLGLTVFDHPDYGPAAIGVQEDVTERKQADERVRELQSGLAHANRFQTLGEIASGLAHELNQPLAAVLLNAGAARLLSAKFESPELNEHLRQIEEQSFRAGEIIRRMRSFIRRDRSRRTDNDVNRLVREVLAMMTDYLCQQTVEVETLLGESLPVVEVDAIQIQQVLVNLIRNAVDATAKNNDRKRTVAICTETHEGAIRIAVSDNGCGLDSVVAKTLFFPFHTTKPSGMGLGLSISRTIIDEHGGQLGFRPNNPCGTTFYFTLPVPE